MSGKSIVIKVCIGVVTVALLSLAIFYLSLPEKIEETPEIAVLSINEEMVDEIEVNAGKVFTLTKGDKAWSMKDMEGVGVNPAYASSLVKSVCNLASPMLTKENADDLYLYGLSDTATTVAIKGDGIDETLRIGNQSGGYFYVCTESEKDVYIVAENDLYMIFMDKMDYLDKDIFSVNEESIDYVSYSDVVLIKKDGEWQEEKPYSLLTATDVVKEKIITPVSSMEAVELVKKDAVTLKEEVTVKVGMGEEEYSFDVCTYESNYYIVKENSNYVYRVTEKEVSFINITGFELLEKYIAPVAISEVSEIKLISPYKTTLLSIEAPSTQAPIFYKDGEEVTEESFRDFYRVLMGLTFKDEGYASGSADYAVIFTKENGEILDVRFIPANDSEYAISINGKTQFVILKKSVTDVFDYLTDIEYVK